MRTNKSAITAIVAFALAIWVAPRLATAQSSPPPPSKDTGQQGEFDGDHQDTGAAAIDRKGGPPEAGEAREGKEGVPGTPASVSQRAVSPKDIESSRESDLADDTRADSALDAGQRGQFDGDHQDVGVAAKGANKVRPGAKTPAIKELHSKPEPPSTGKR